MQKEEENKFCTRVLFVIGVMEVEKMGIVGERYLIPGRSGLRNCTYSPAKISI